jgi:hypothetical protein
MPALALEPAIVAKWRVGSSRFSNSAKGSGICVILSSSQKSVAFAQYFFLAGGHKQNGGRPLITRRDRWLKSPHLQTGAQRIIGFLD